MKPCIAIIPCKTDSKRVKLKNLQLINNKTLLEISIDYAKKSSLIQQIYVSTESDDVKNIAIKNGVQILERPNNLLADAEVCDVYVEAFQQLSKSIPDIAENFSYLVALQPDHPDRDTNIDQLINYAYDNKYDDLFTVSSAIVRTGSVRILKISHLIEGMVSRRVGCYKDDATNIHSLQDLSAAASRIKNR